MRTGNGKKWMRWLVTAGVLAFATLAWAGLPFRCGPNGGVEFQSDNKWWATGYTQQDLTAAGLTTCHGASYGERLREENARTHAVGEARGASRDYYSITLNTTKGELRPRLRRRWCWGCCYCDIPPAEIPEWQVFWGVSASYQSDDFDVLSGGPAAGKTRTRSQTLEMTALHENWRVKSSLTYDRVDPDSALGDLAFDRLSLRVTPMYSLLEQAADGFDLALITSGAVSRSWFEGGTGVDDPMHVFGGAGLGIGRTFSFGDLRLAAMYAVQKNTSGDEEVTGKGTIPMRIVSGAYTVGFARNWLASIGLDYVHTGDLPGDYDSNEYYGTASLGYHTERWEASLGVTRSIHNDNQRSWSVTGNVTFRW